MSSDIDSADPSKVAAKHLKQIYENQVNEYDGVAKDLERKGLYHHLEANMQFANQINCSELSVEFKRGLDEYLKSISNKMQRLTHRE